MQLKSLPSVGNKIEIILYDQDNSKTKQCVSMIQDIIHDQIITTVPMYEGIEEYLQIGSCVQIIFYKGDGQYSVKAHMQERFKHNDIPFMRFVVAGSVKKAQRRKYFRLKVVLPVSIYPIAEDKPSIETPPSQGYSLDLSGGGIRIISSSYFDKGSNIVCSLEFMEDKVVPLRGKVVRIEKTADHIDKYDISVAFTDIDENKREEIIKFIFEKQRELRRKGLL